MTMILRAIQAGVIAVFVVWVAGSAQAGGTTRYYQIATPELVVRTIPPYHNNEAALSFAIDAPGRVTAVHMIATQKIRASIEDRVVGSVWVNASNGPTIDDLFCVCADVPPMTLHKLADVGMPQTSDMPVQPGDVVTILLGDEQSGAPPLPPATWVIEVEE